MVPKLSRVARSDSNDGALASELGKLNEEYGETQNRLEEVGHTMEAMGSGGPTEEEVRDALQGLDPVWDELFPAERERIVKLLIKEAILSADGLDIGVRTNGLRSLATELADGAEAKMAADSATVTVHVPMTFKVRCGRKEIFLPPDAHTTRDVGPQWPIVVALAKGRTGGSRCWIRGRSCRSTNWRSDMTWTVHMLAGLSG